MPEMRVSQLWRYPVKSLKGETLTSATLTSDGVEGDRVVHVAGLKGPLTGRTRHGLLTVAATTGPDRVPQVDGYRWDSEHAAELVHQHAGPGARLVADRSPERFDILNLLVATDGAVERFGHDVRRLRPNVVISGIAADLEPELPGTALAIGDALIGVHSVRQRCIVTTVDPDTGHQDLDVLRRIRDVFGNELALNAWVIRGGVVTIGDSVEVVPLRELPDRIGGWIVGAPYPHVQTDECGTRGLTR
ncbi:MOSC domain-containing protein [Pengzhenrongella phosphoraccumulans]|uniref:MOSC domain-containing protein n=1 Tax=Pengzhenrongella phosphoraccumulans TaxID=3114394 RepID=UPI00388D3D00